jgi:hypothetical protein
MFTEFRVNTVEYRSGDRTHDDPVGSAVVAACDGSEPLLSCCIPLSQMKQVLISDRIVNRITVSALHNCLVSTTTMHFACLWCRNFLQHAYSTQNGSW